MNIKIRPVVIGDYDRIYELWNSTEQSRRAMNPVDDSKDGIERYLKRNPTTCFLAYMNDGTENDIKVVGVILMILSILVYTLFSRIFDLMQPPVVKHSIVVA